MGFEKSTVAAEFHPFVERLKREADEADRIVREREAAAGESIEAQTLKLWGITASSEEERANLESHLRTHRINIPLSRLFFREDQERKSRGEAGLFPSAGDGVGR